MSNYLSEFRAKWNNLSFPLRSAFLMGVPYLLWYLVGAILPGVMEAFLSSAPVDWFTRMHSELFGVLFPPLLSFSIEQSGNLFRLDNGQLLSIIWGCTGLKVYFIFLVAQLLNYRPSRRQLMVIGLSFLLIFVLNTLRVYLSFLAYRYMPSSAVLIHDLLGKVLYVLIYLFWNVYEDRISKKTESIAGN